jgi:hypothetical protein
MSARHPVFILEGPGDAEAVPLLARRIYNAHGLYDAAPAPRPKTGVEIRKLESVGQLERYVNYGLREVDGDCVVIALDCDDDDPRKVIPAFEARIAALNPAKPVKVALFLREYECMFLHCLPEIAEAYPEHGWKHPFPPIESPEAIRGAKGALSELMGPSRTYKPTRDQARFTNVIPLDKLRACSASFKAFEALLLTLAA